MLDAGWCRQLGDADVRALVAASGRRLARVRLDCTRVGDSGACMLASRCPHLAALSLAGCVSLGTRGAAALATLARRLEELDVSRSALGDAGARWWCCYRAVLVGGEPAVGAGRDGRGSGGCSR